MKLKKLLESTPGFENRKFGDKLPTLDSVKAAYQAKKGLKEEDGMVRTTKDGFDYQYFIDQVAAAEEAVEAVEEELVRTLDGLAEDEAVYGLVRDKAEQAANQVRRYINGAQKQLEGIQKMLDRAQRNGEYDA
jgi:DNA-binding FrmR family transcriptional regulator